MIRKLKKLYIFLVVIIIWQLLTMLNLWSSYILPPPIKVLDTAINMMKDGSIFVDMFVSIKRVAIGFSISFIFAVFFATIFTIFPKLNIYFSAFLEFFKNIPPLSLIPILILWVGIGEANKIVIIVLASFFPLFLNIQKGFMVVDPNLLELGDVFSYNKFEKFIIISVPSALKDIFIICSFTTSGLSAR